MGHGNEHGLACFCVACCCHGAVEACNDVGDARPDTRSVPRTLAARYLSYGAIAKRRPLAGAGRIGGVLGVWADAPCTARPCLAVRTSRHPQRPWLQLKQAAVLVLGLVLGLGRE